MCLYPKLIENKKYKANKKNGGVIPPIFDERVKKVAVGCGECIECKKKKSREWTVRLNEEIRENKNGVFITLTFSNESYKELLEIIRGKEDIKGYDLDNEIAILGVRRFLERWRKKHKKSIRHWLVTELGSNGTENIHLHGIIWTNKAEDIKEIWKYGHVWDGHNKNGIKENYVNEKTVNYIVKYINKIDEKHKTYKSKILTSAGIGKGYISRQDSKKNKYKEEETKEYYRTRQGIKLALPIYYRNKIYTEKEREKLWIQKLDKEERYVLGEKISIKEGEKEYYEALIEAQEWNKNLGYGNGEKNWEKAQYERERRILKQQERIRRR